MSKYFVTKTFNPSKGYSCVFRNHRAKSHCAMMHGYDLVFAITFECDPDKLTKEGWVIDFGGLGLIKERIEDTFDHKMLVADDDPQKDALCALAGLGVADVVVLPHIGVEAFSQWLAIEAQEYLFATKQFDRVSVRTACVYEHGANMGGFQP